MLDRYLVGTLIGIVIQFGSLNMAYSQNLVPNGSFEEGINCPTQGANLTLECANWYSSLILEDGGEATPDWFHGCAEEAFFVPPEVWNGYQEPWDGTGYVGLVTYSSNGQTFQNTREIIGVELSEPLEVGATYYVEFRASTMHPQDQPTETNRLGFKFSTNEYFSELNFPWNQSHYAVTEIIPWSLDWFQVSSSFVADSGYTYIHIGNFFDDDHTETNVPFGGGNYAYYVIDGVSVSQVLSTSENSLSPAITVYPNPAHSRIQIKTESELRDATVSIYSATGNKVFEEYYRNWATGDQIDVSDFEQGMYCLRIISPQGVFVESFIKN